MNWSMFPTLTAMVPVMMLFAHAMVATFLVFAHALVLPHALVLAHAHAMVVGLNLLMFFC